MAAKAFCARHRDTRTGPWRASLGIANLFDRKYFTYAVRSQFVADRFNAYPLPERSFWVALEYRGS